ncbi:hypothetical protein Pan241w_35870 [Gimesia alba]|uniref:Uncharacterized protein n=1 Tax=Gimesia alba TaxID=2527973 RepID=A0A517RHY5_9PLAN|nr:hypothetical protein [Gimesia alba]QDT43486.1 hypothetical protein Pan241w_35870 [Gimesia alba]
MIYLWKCDREQFVEFISRRTPVLTKGVVKSEILEDFSVQGDDILLAWNSSPTEVFSLPRAAIVAEGKTQDFLAWCSTYFRNIRPFTAHCRVESPSNARLAASASATNWTTGNRSVDLGLIITEAIAYSIGRVDINRLPFSAFTRTMSYAIAKAVRNYEVTTVSSQEYQDHIEQGWEATRKLVGNAPLELSPSDIRSVWETVLFCESQNNKSNDLLANALREIKLEGQLSKNSWINLMPDAEIASKLWIAMEGPREGRVVAVEHGIQVLGKGTKSTRKIRAFAMGYLASRVRPGSLDHLSLVFPLIDDLRESLLWYGVCAGIVPETTVDNYSKGLGWLMRRELGRPSHWLERPVCDIALPELKTLLENREDGKPEFRTISRGVLDVEILPLISTNVRWVDQTDSEVVYKREIQKSLFREESRLDMEVHEILRRIEESAMSLDAIREHVERALGKSKPKRRSRRK